MAYKSTKRRKTKREKLYHSITEVGELTKLKPHILRYWETEFPFLRPKRNRAGNRAYRKKDIEMIHLIKRLLYEEGYTIEGAKHKIRRLRKEQSAANKAGLKPSEPLDDADKHKIFLFSVREELENICKLLEKEWSFKS